MRIALFMRGRLPGFVGGCDPGDDGHRAEEAAESIAIPRGAGGDHGTAVRH
jgi:hypothetical protein